MCKAPSVGSKSNKLLLSWLPWTSKRMIKLCNVEEGGETGERERTRSLGPKRNSSTTGTTGDHVSEQAWVSCSPCVCWTRGPWIWTWSACLPLCHPWTWSGTLRTQREEWLPEKLSPSASPFPLTCFCGPFLPNRSKGERRIERERERDQNPPCWHWNGKYLAEESYFFTRR